MTIKQFIYFVNYLQEEYPSGFLARYFVLKLNESSDIFY